MLKFAAGDECEYEDDFYFGQDSDLPVISEHGDTNEPTRDVSKSSTKSNCVVNKADNCIILLSDLQNAVINGNVDAVKSMLKDRSALCNTLLDSGWTALIYASNFGNIKIVETLLNAECDVNLTGPDKLTALMAACKCQRSKAACIIIQLLIKSGADVSVCDKNGKTSLIHAVRNGCLDAVKLLLHENNCNINSKDNKAWTALDWAISNSFHSAVKCLTEAGACVYSVHEHTDIEPSIKECLPIIECTSNEDVEMDKPNNNNVETATGHQPAMADMNDACNAKINFMSTSLVPQATDDMLTINTGICGNSYQRYGQLELLLCGLDLSHLISKFHEHDFRFEQLLCATMEDLIEIGVHQLGARNRILTAIKDWHSTEWTESSLPNFSSTKLTFANLQAVLRTSSEHLLYISSALRYTRNQLEMHPQLLVPSASVYYEKNPDELVVSQVEKLLHSSHKLCQSLKLLHHQVVHLGDNKTTDFTQADCIKSTNFCITPSKLVCCALPVIASALLWSFKLKH